MSQIVRIHLLLVYALLVPNDLHTRHHITHDTIIIYIATTANGYSVRATRQANPQKIGGNLLSSCEILRESQLECHYIPRDAKEPWRRVCDGGSASF